jgi:exopolysaccharide production protein ExoQ
MGKRVRMIWEFVVSHILPLFKYLILVLTLYLSIERILLWTMLDAFIYSSLNHLLGVHTPALEAVTINRLAITHWLAIFTVIGSLILLTTNKYFRRFKFWLASIPFLGIMIVSGISRYWSVNISLTDYRLLAFSAVALGSFYIGLEFDKKRLISLLEVFAGVIILGCLFEVYRHPNVAIMSLEIQGANPGAWLGLFWWNIYLGEVMVFDAILFLFQVSQFKNQPWIVTCLSIIFYGLSLLILIKSRSATETIALLGAHVIFLLVIVYLKWGRLLKPVHWWSLLAVFICALLAAWFGRGALLHLVGKSSNFTGRIPLWIELTNIIRQRPFTGYGFGGAIWRTQTYRDVIWAVITWRPPHAHNGFIEAFLDTGLFGFLFWLLFLVQIAWLSIQNFFRTRTLAAGLFLIFLVEIVISNIADAQLGSYETFAWFLLVTLFTVLLGGRLEKQLHQDG